MVKLEIGRRIRLKGERTGVIQGLGVQGGSPVTTARCVQATTLHESQGDVAGSQDLQARVVPRITRNRIVTLFPLT